MSKNKFEVLKKYLDNNLSKRFILILSSSAAAPVLFVKKLEGSLQLSVDSRGFNAIIINIKYLLLPIRKTLDRLSNIIYFTKLNIIAAFNKICMAAGEE